MKKTCRICHTRRAFVQCAFFHVPPSDISSRMIYCILSKNLVFLRCEHYEPLCEKPKKSRVQMTLDMFGMKKVFIQNVPSHDFSISYFLQMSFGFDTREPFHSEMYQRGSPLYKLFGAGWGQKGVGGFFFKNPTTQLRVVWGLTEKKCEQTPKFACFSV